MSGCGILENVEVPIPNIRFDSNTYVVQPGDTLESVSSRYKIDPDSLVSVNSLEMAELVPGQKLILIRDEEIASMAALASHSSRGKQIAEVPAAGPGQSMALPNTAQAVSVPNPPLQGQDQFIQDGMIVDSGMQQALQQGVQSGTEEIIGVVNAGDELLGDEQPVFLPEDNLQPLQTEGEGNVAMVQPDSGGVETVIQSVTVNDPVLLPNNGSVAVPNSGSVAVADASDQASIKRVTVNTSNAGWNWPALGAITQGFDLGEINRQGVDIDPGPGAGVQAAADGEVVYSGRDLASYGNLVILRHDDNFLSAYSKVGDIFVKENQTVRAGELIASVGNEKTEMHFEIRRNGEPVDPIDYLPAL